MGETWLFESTLSASSIQIFKTLESNEQEIIKSIMEQLRQRHFMWHPAQGFDQSSILHSYEAEEIK